MKKECYRENVLTIYGHLYPDGATFTLGVGRFADVLGRVVSINRREQKGLPDAGDIGSDHAEVLRTPPNYRSRWICVGQTSYL